MSENLPEREIAEILPYNIGELSARESAPLLSRASSRIDILRPKDDFWEGMKENLRGASAWIDAKKGEISAKTLRAIAGASLVTTMIAACAKPPETPYLPTEAPRITETIPTVMPLPTEISTPVYSRVLPAGQEQGSENFKGYIEDPQDGSLWRMQAEDLSLAGNSQGSFDGWAEESSIPESDRQAGVRWGKWRNAEGMGVVRFIRNDTVIEKDGAVWVMVPEDYDLVGETPGIFGGWVSDSSVSPDEIQEGIRWGLWSNSGGQGRVRFENLVEQYTGPLVDATENRSRGIPEIEEINRKDDNEEIREIHIYRMPLTLVSQNQLPGTEITEQIWGFRLKDSDYRFRTRSTVCAIPGYSGDVITFGDGYDTLAPDTLETGQVYKVGFNGFAQSPSPRYLRYASADCKNVLQSLRVDPQDPARLKRFFGYGESLGFAVDESGIVDLSNVVFSYVFGNQ